MNANIFLILMLVLVGIVGIVIQLYKAKNINTYNIEVVQVQDTDKQDWSGKVIKYIDIAGNENEAVISDTKYDTDLTYIEMKRYKWWFLYEDNNVLHIKLNQEK